MAPFPTAEHATTSHDVVDAIPAVVRCSCSRTGDAPAKPLQIVASRACSPGRSALGLACGPRRNTAFAVPWGGVRGGRRHPTGSQRIASSMSSPPEASTTQVDERVGCAASLAPSIIVVHDEGTRAQRSSSGRATTRRPATRSRVTDPTVTGHRQRSRRPSRRSCVVG